MSSFSQPIYWIALAILTLLPASSSAQYFGWTKVGSFPGTMCPYFVNDSLGFAYNCLGGVEATIGDTSQVKLYRTTNGGSTWTAINTGQAGRAIQDVYFRNATVGYFAATVGRSNRTGSDRGGVFETLDGGLTWRRISQPMMSFSGVYATDSAVFAVSSVETKPGGKELGLGITSDHGATWNYLKQPNEPATSGGAVTGNRDNIVIVSETPSDSSEGTVVSTDGGKTWSTDQSRDGWSAAMRAHSTEAYLVRSFSGKVPGVIQQYDPVGHKSGSISIGNYITGGIAVSPCGIVCYQYTRPPGVARILGPHSITSRQIGGPPGVVNTRSLSLAGNGDVVYAMDTSHNIWKWAAEVSDMNDHTPIVFYDSILKQQRDTLIISECSSLSLSYKYYFRQNCIPLSIDSLYIEGLPHATSLAVQPRVVPSNEKIGFVNANYQNIPPGIYRPIIHFRTLREDGMDEDTIVQRMLLTVQPGTTAQVVFPTTRMLDFGKHSACEQPVRRTLALHVEGCGDLTFDSIRVFGPDRATYERSTAVSARTINSRNGALSFDIVFDPQRASDPARPRDGFIVIYTSKAKDTIYVTGTVSNQYERLENTDSVYVAKCDTSAKYFELRNFGCDSVTLDSAAIGANRVDEIPSRSLPAGYVVQFLFHPMLDHLGTSQLKLFVHRPASASDTTLTVVLNVTKCLTDAVQASDVHGGSNVRITPSPVNNRMLIRCDDNASRIQHVDLFDVLGKNVLSSTFDANRSMDVSAISSGIYFVRVELSSGIVKTSRIQISH